MKKILLMSLLVVGDATAICAQREFVSITNVKNEYRTLTEVEPILENHGHQSLYLWPQQCGEALVSWRGGEYWYDGDVRPCPTFVSPVEVKPGEKYYIPKLVLRFEQADGSFGEERRGVPGEFRITIFYSFKAAYKNGPPQLRESVSKEFSLLR